MAGDFVRAVAYQLPQRYVEIVSSIGESTAFWRRAGFVDYGPTAGGSLGRRQTYYGGGTITARTRVQSMLSQMRYYLLDKGSATSTNSNRISQ